MRRLFACVLVAGCGSSPGAGEPKPLVAAGSACTQTLECAKGLYCAAGACAEPNSEEEQHAVDIATLERKIAETHRHEAKAFTEDGKRRMRKQRAEFQAKLEALGSD